MNSLNVPLFVAVLFFQVITFGTYALGQEQCGFHQAWASGYLLATGLNSSFELNTANSPISISQSSCFAVTGSHSVTSYGGSGFVVANPVGQFVSSVNYAASNGNLSLKLTAFAEGGRPFSPTAGGEVQVGWNDRLQLVWEGAGPPPLLPSNDLSLKYQLTGNVDADINGVTGVSSGIFSSASVSASIFGQGPTYSVSENAVFNPLDDPIFVNTEVGAEATLGSDLSLSFAPVLRVSVSTSFGTGTADAGNTLRFKSITFTDGTTPEDLGYRIVFDSGIQSPNVIPEPTSFAVWLGITNVVVIGTKLWRRCVV